MFVIDTSVAKLRGPSLDGPAERDVVTLAVRPENLRIVTDESAGDELNTLAGTVVAKNFSGNLLRTVVDIGNDNRFIVESRPHEDAAESGATVTLTWDPAKSLVLTK